MLFRAAAERGVVSRRSGVQSGTDRRLATRYAAGLACKVRRRGGIRYDSGETVDVSANGVSFVTDAANSFVPGESLEIGVMWSPSDAVIGRDQMVRGVVTRVFEGGIGGIGRVSIALVPVANEESTRIWTRGVGVIALSQGEGVRKAA